jgi:SAM-dependent methyltransferase
MKKTVISYLKKQMFQPNLGAIVINPFWFIRRGLYKNIKLNAGELTGKVLDFGCGSKPYENLFKNATEYIGVDLEVTGHDHKLSKVDTYYNGKDIPYPDGYFDSVFASEVFEHVDNLEEIITEIHRVLNKDGKMLITVPFVWNEHEIPYDFRRFSKFGLESILINNHFKIEKTITTTHFIETLFQLFVLYIYHLFSSKSKLLNLVFTVIFIFPLNIIGLIITNIFPKNRSLYHNVVIIAKKG